MAHVNLDEIALDMVDWDLTIEVGGKSVLIARPNPATMALVEEITQGRVPRAKLDKALSDALAGLVDAAAGVDPRSWPIEKRIAAVAAIYTHVNRSSMRNIGKIGPAVVKALDESLSDSQPTPPSTAQRPRKGRKEGASKGD